MDIVSTTFAMASTISQGSSGLVSNVTAIKVLKDVAIACCGAGSLTSCASAYQRRNRQETKKEEYYMNMLAAFFKLTATAMQIAVISGTQDKPTTEGLAVTALTLSALSGGLSGIAHELYE